MMLTTLLSRGFLLIAIAASAGMCAQEMVSRLSSADEQPAEASRVSQQGWQSAEAFYHENPRVQRMFAQTLPEPATTHPVVSEANAEPLIDEVAERSPARPGAIAPIGPEVIVAQSPYTSSTGSWNEDSYSEWDPASTSDSEEFDDSTCPTAAAQVAPTDERSFGESVSIVMADDPPPLVDLQAPLGDDNPVPPADILSPPAVGASSPRDIATDTLPMPRPQALPVSPVERVDLLADEAMSNVAAGDGCSGDARYLDPEQLVRERAIERGEQRKQRLEARRWLGYSSLRPPVQASPFTSGDPLRPIVVFVPRTVVVQEESSAVER